MNEIYLTFTKGCSFSHNEFFGRTIPQLGTYSSYSIYLGKILIGKFLYLKNGEIIASNNISSYRYRYKSLGHFLRMLEKRSYTKIIYNFR